MAMMDERQQQLNKRWKRYRVGVGLIIFVLFASGGAVYSFVPKVHNAVDGIVMDIKSSKDDVKSLGSVMESFDEQLEQVAVRGEQIDSATKQLGIDPNSVGEGDDLNMEAEMRELMGDDAVTVTDRSHALQSTFGIVQTAAGRDGKYDKKKDESANQEASNFAPPGQVPPASGSSQTRAPFCTPPSGQPGGAVTKGS